jgi:hypothetical protein
MGETQGPFPWGVILVWTIILAIIALGVTSVVLLFI